MCTPYHTHNKRGICHKESLKHWCFPLTSPEIFFNEFQYFYHDHQQSLKTRLQFTTLKTASPVRGWCRAECFWSVWWDPLSWPGQSLWVWRWTETSHILELLLLPPPDKKIHMYQNYSTIDTQVTEDVQSILQLLDSCTGYSFSSRQKNIQWNLYFATLNYLSIWFYNFHSNSLPCSQICVDLFVLKYLFYFMTHLLSEQNFAFLKGQISSCPLLGKMLHHQGSRVDYKANFSNMGY